VITCSNLAFGCEQLGGKDWGEFNKRELFDAVNCAFELGVHTFDTADVYGLGESESNLATALGNKRKDVRIITKCGVRWGSVNPDMARAPTFKDCSSEHIKRSVDGSLRRLNIDAIPLYMIHWPDRTIDLCETLGAMQDLIKDGKILSFGLSNHEENDVEVGSGSYGLSAVQGSFNIIDQKRFLRMFQSAKAAGVECFSYGPLAQGLLTGKYNENYKFDSNDRRHRLSHFSQTMLQRRKPILKQLIELAKKYEKTPAQIALRWVLDSGVSDTVIFGGKNVEQVKSNISVLDWSLGNQDVEMFKCAAQENALQ